MPQDDQRDTGGVVCTIGSHAAIREEDCDPLEHDEAATASGLGGADSPQEQGNVTTVLGTETAADDAIARVRASTVTDRLRREGRWKGQAETARNDMMSACKRQGMSQEAAQAWTYAELDRMYPPLPHEQTTQPDECDGDSTPDDAGDGDGQSLARARARENHLQGLDPPDDWPTIPANAALPVELSWVQANRLRVVEERPSGQTLVHLERADSPAPSWAALGWLETSIRSYAKYVDICAKGLGQQELESDLVKRERRSIEDVRALLAEMYEQHK